MIRFCVTMFIVALTTCILNISAVSKPVTTATQPEKTQIKTPSYVKKEDAREIEELIQGAIKNKTWMSARDKKELHDILSRYFTGSLLEELTEETWQFIKTDTDWYGAGEVEKITFNSIDENMIRVLAYIKEYDVVNESTVAITGDFVLIKTDEGWRIQQLTLKENRDRHYGKKYF